MRVSELITIDHIKSWNPSDIVTIKAGTGRGKSYFIKNNLHALAKKDNKKILFLLHRTNCINQFQQEIISDNKQDTIHIKSYQHIEALIKKNKQFDFTLYKYIVCDEFHYFMSDAAFNKTTDMSLNTILEQSDKIRLFMSATGDYMKKYINNYKKLNTIDYEIPLDYSFIDNLTLFTKDTTLDTFMKDAIRTNQKGIFFIQSAKKAYELYKKYEKHCLFNCSQNNKEYYKHVNTDKINNMLLNEKFDELILITTTCLDTGVNIHDKELKHIVCDVRDIGTIIQCIGRKRLSKDDNKLNVYIKSLTNQQLGGIETQLRKKIAMAMYLRQNGIEAYVKKYQRELDHSNIIYDDIINGQLTKKINDLIYFKCLIDINDIDCMKKDKFGYSNAVSKHLNKYNIRWLEEDNERMELNEYLESVIGKRILKDGQKELINKISLKDSRGRLQKGINTLNAYLKDNKFNYLIVSKRTSEREGEKTKTVRYWEIINNIEIN
ncbi:DEAD/DEAH box helicase family protein [uncultured Metabacillus sp.]|uniref:DEAD/DEAH box helicase family protein n=1 Tax=uncultured Metabacillus sp. TaxID=2860135 RepID=UPI00260B666F|nr:DEAD/DEAH box helicase family protein [uncultured Metabacillus sp.]